MNYIDNLFHFYDTTESFELHKKQKVINPDSICFLKETGQIYTQNTLFGVSKEEFDKLVQLVNNHETKIEKVLEEIKNSIVSSESKFKLDSIAPIDIAYYLDSDDLSNIDKGIILDHNDFGILNEDGSESSGSGSANELENYIASVYTDFRASKENYLRNLRFRIESLSLRKASVVLNLDKIIIEENNQHTLIYSGQDSYNKDYYYELSIHNVDMYPGYTYRLIRIKKDIVKSGDLENIEEQINNLGDIYQPKGDYLTEVPDTYATKDYVEEEISKIDIPSIEGLATEEYVDEAIKAIDVTDQLGDYAKTTEVDKKISDVRNEIPSLDDYYNKEAVDSKVSNIKSEILGGAGKDYDTLKEIETWINDHQNLYQALIQGLATKATITYVDEELATKASAADVYKKTETYSQTEIDNKIEEHSERKWFGNQEEYNLIASKDEDTLYYIYEEE